MQITCWHTPTIHGWAGDLVKILLGLLQVELYTREEIVHATLSEVGLQGREGGREGGVEGEGWEGREREGWRGKEREGWERREREGVGGGREREREGREGREREGVGGDREGGVEGEREGGVEGEREGGVGGEREGGVGSWEREREREGVEGREGGGERGECERILYEIKIIGPSPHLTSTLSPIPARLSCSPICCNTAVAWLVSVCSNVTFLRLPES